MPWINGADAPISVPLTTETDPQTGVEVVTAWRPEYHVNLPTFPKTPDEFADAHPALIPYLRTPSFMSRMFAGDEDPTAPTMTAALQFADEAQARSVLAAWWTLEDAGS